MTLASSEKLIQKVQSPIAISSSHSHIIRSIEPHIYIEDLVICVDYQSYPYVSNLAQTFVHQRPIPTTSIQKSETSTSYVHYIISIPSIIMSTIIL